MNYSKKGQEEVVGFVVIVVLVAVVFVILLGFSSHKPIIQEKTSKDLRNYLESVRVVTTDCKLTQDQSEEFKSLISSCYQGQTCTSGKKACEVLNLTALNLLNSAFPVGIDYQAKGTKFNIVYSQAEEKQEQEIISLSKGNCSSLSYRSADDFFPLGTGQITVKIKLCY